jgi:hypothetical protein
MLLYPVFFDPFIFHSTIAKRQSLRGSHLGRNGMYTGYQIPIRKLTKSHPINPVIA